MYIYIFVYVSVGAKGQHGTAVPVRAVGIRLWQATECGRGTLPVVCFGRGLLGKNTLLSNIKRNEQDLMSRFRAEYNQATQTMLLLAKWSLMVVVVDLLMAFVF